MKPLIKIVLILFTALIIIGGAFISGMLFYANFFVPSQDSSTTASLPFFPAIADTSPAAQIEDEDIPPEMETFWEAWSYLNENFYGDIPADDERIYGAIRGMVTSFGDQHTGFIDPVRAAITSENMQGSFSGIGATVRMDEAGRLIIADPMPDHPAFLAGVRPNDVVLEVDDQLIEGMSLYEAVLLIRGPTGSTVTLTILREGETKPLEIDIVRAKIELEIVETELLDLPNSDEKIGYVRLAQFVGGAADQVTEAIEELEDQGATKLIFDLRSNPGGLLSEAVNVSSIFVETGEVVVREKLRGEEDKVFESKRGYQDATEIPLVILVNGGSASASEIVAGAIQDLGRATVIGEQTFGKGSVQLPHKLSDGSELRVTIAEWLTPENRQIHGEGITPDIEVEMTFDDFEEGNDPQRDEAIEFLSEAE